MLTSCRIALARGRKRLPAVVRDTRLLERTNSRAPSCSSSRLIPADRVGWVIRQAWAAFVKLPVSTRDRK